MTLLRVEGLGVRYRPGAPLALDGVSFDLERGKTLALVGESGSGKSTAALAVLRLLPDGAKIEAGTVTLDGVDLTRLTEAELCGLRGRKIGTVFQDPHGALSPLSQIGDQISESLRLHESLSRSLAWARAVDLLREVGMPDPAGRARQYPHQLSGGLKQRALIAAAIACNPPLLIADEPTTALDVTLQAQVLELLRRLRDERGLGLLLITHDLGIVAEMADEVAVMRAGRVVERAEVRAFFAGPAHEYSRSLLAAVPGRVAPSASVEREPHDGSAGPVGDAIRSGLDHGAHAPRSPGPPLLQVRGLVKRFGPTRAVDGVDLTLAEGETLALVGESGCGKSTTGRCVLRLIEPDAGRVLFGGEDVLRLRGNGLLVFRRRAQIIFQDPLGALNPRRSIGDTLAEPIRVHRLVLRNEVVSRVNALLEMVGLGPEVTRRYPHELSGGQRQRVVIARALSMGPRLIVADEPTASLDVSVQAQVLALLADLQQRLGVAYLFISHNLAVVRQLAARTSVMYLGRVVEQGPTAGVLGTPLHPYTQALVAAVPVPDPTRVRMTLRVVGEPPDPRNVPPGCRFHPRCPVRVEECDRIDPEHRSPGGGQSAACVHVQGEPGA